MNNCQLLVNNLENEDGHDFKKKWDALFLLANWKIPFQQIEWEETMEYKEIFC